MLMSFSVAVEAEVALSAPHRANVRSHFANPVWLQYMSHKVGRLVVPWALVTLFLASAAAAPSHWFYAVALAAQAGFYGLAALGAWMDRQQARGPGVEMTTPIGARGAR